MLEKDVLLACKNKLDWWRHLKVVIHFERINSGSLMVNGRPIRMAQAGSPDLWAFFKHKDVCWIYFIEAKKSGGGNWRSEQKEFATKFSGMNNVIYEIVEDPKQVDVTIEEITGYSQEMLGRI